MTVTDIWYDQRMIRIYRQECETLYTEEPQALIYRCAILCNRAEFVNKEDAKKHSELHHENQERQLSNASRLAWGKSAKDATQLLQNEELPAFKGNPSDVALLSYFNKTNAVALLRQEYPVIFEVPFNSTNKWQLVIVKSLPQIQLQGVKGTECEYQILMKGAPEVILALCSTYSSKRDKTSLDQESAMTESFRDEFLTTYEGFASHGRRVLAFASKKFKAPSNAVFDLDESGNYNFPTKDLKFIGMTAIMDPPRDNVPDAIVKIWLDHIQTTAYLSTEQRITVLRTSKLEPV